MISEYKMCIWILGGRVPVTGMLAGVNLSKSGMNLSKPGMNLSKLVKKHNNHVIILPKGARRVPLSLESKINEYLNLFGQNPLRKQKLAWDEALSQLFPKMSLNKALSTWFKKK